VLIAVIAEKNYLAAKQKIQAVSKQVDAIELRLDYFFELNVAKIKQLKKEFSLPMIFTLRKHSQGGLFSNSEVEHLTLIKKLAALEPEYIDLEYDVATEFAIKLKQQHPAIQLICSYHDFQQTPDNLAQLLNNMKHAVYSIYKIVTFAQSTLDCLKMLQFVQAANADTKLTGFCMGKFGTPSRILGAVVGNILHYASVDAVEVAPGQLSLSDMLNIYHLRTLNSDTKIFALLGNPVAQSPGHIVHNQAFQQLNKNALYVKLNLKPTELKYFFDLIKTLPFGGFSITIPYKQDVIAYLDKIDDHAKSMNSVNTVVINNGKLIGYNTDAKGALAAIENKMKVANKKIVIIGAGGTARAIGHEALQRGAQVVYLNRTVQKARDLAAEMRCAAYGFDDLVTVKTAGYDILINTTPLGMSGHSDALPVPTDFLIPHSVIMDVVYNPVHTPLLKAAQALNCIVIYGYEMFINQAVLQLRLWFNDIKENDFLSLSEKFLILLGFK
jgi:3-dehydroquinate dehydratase / shikimate dehydrogenase